MFKALAPVGFFNNPDGTKQLGQIVESLLASVIVFAVAGENVDIDIPAFKPGMERHMGFGQADQGGKADHFGTVGEVMKHWLANNRQTVMANNFGDPTLVVLDRMQVITRRQNCFAVGN